MKKADVANLKAIYLYLQITSKTKTQKKKFQNSLEVSNLAVNPERKKVCVQMNKSRGKARKHWIISQDLSQNIHLANQNVFSHLVGVRCI